MSDCLAAILDMGRVLLTWICRRTPRSAFP